MYNVAVRDIAERTQIIADKCNASAQRETFFQFVSGPRDLPVVDVEIGLLLYRLANYRTQTQQMGYTRTRQLPPEFFKNGQEDVSAQQAQHSILVDFSNQGSGESIVPIYDVLQNSRQQNESLLITREGVVVNGNRRLSAMRELYASEPSTYVSFASVRAKVLPAGLTAIEIKRIETRLQMTPQTLLPYDWVNEALAIRDLRDLGLTDAEIAAEMKLVDPDEIEDALERLGEAELYLTEYLRAPQQYEKIIPHKQQFIELNKALSRHRNSVQKELARKICYVLTANSEGLGRRAYDYRFAYGTELDRVVSDLSERLGVPLPDEPVGDILPEDDLLSDGTPPIEQFAPIIERLNDQGQSQAIAVEITEICNNIRESQNAQNASQSALRKAQKAHTLLAEITLEAAAPSTLPAIAAQLRSISARANYLLNGVNQRNTGS
jgi:hypothetical protein